jgi:hypothetical protein
MFNRHDICEAYYLFGSLYHSGQGSKEYGYLSRLSKIGFRPRASLLTQGEHALSENALYIFEELIARNGE